MIGQLFLLALLLWFTIPIIRAFLDIRHKKRLSARIPGDEGSFILGHVTQLGFDPQVIASRIITKMNRENREIGHKLVKLWFLGENVYMPTCGETLKDILDSSEEITKGDEYAVFIPWLGRGLLTSTGDKWRSRRKMLTPTFHFSMLDGYVSTMNRHAKICVQLLEEKAGKEVDMYSVVKMCALDIICEAAMGKELDSQHHPNQPYVAAILDLVKLGTEIAIKFYLHIKIVRQIVGIEKAYGEAMVVAHAFTKTVIAERADALSRGEVERNKRAFLDMLLEQREKQNLSDEDIREEVDTFMFEGHDTTSAGLGWTIWCLANHPHVQERAYREVIEAFGDNCDLDIGREDMGKFAYLDRCIKEAMRIYPPVPFVSRQLTKDFPLGKYLLPVNSQVSISPFVVHRNESIYPNATQYDPDRFLPENVAARNAYDYIPFSAGPRNCIGQSPCFFLKYLVTFVATLKNGNLQDKNSLNSKRRLFLHGSFDRLNSHPNSFCSSKLKKKSELFRSFESQRYATEAILRPIDGIIVNVERR
ncbi:hypothetical protein PRIPAC_82163 [Pristionchus pacificus]|nr:hypothetical protein PRIPAC_82163 [Pristionchus pacificus]